MEEGHLHGASSHPFPALPRRMRSSRAFQTDPQPPASGGVPRASDMLEQDRWDVARLHRDPCSR